ncbi:iron ABC transporter permease [Alicyclobacillaceae bacterium I2511]|nr:iron ABC transporter permease [Alicyclobacillaceae bacterium I2511]
MRVNSRVGSFPVFFVLCGLLLVALTLEVSLGPIGISPGKIISATLAYFQGSRGADAVVMGAIRWPRALVAALVGGSLAATGAVLQAIFRNPMADPGIIGVSSGGSLGAVAVIQLGWSQAGIWVTPVAAFLTGLLTVWVIYRLATVQGRTALYALLLAGVALGSLASALMSLLLSLAPLETMQQILFWLMGGLDDSSWPVAGILAGVTLVGGGFYFWLAPALDVLSLGEEQAEGVGVSLQRMKQLALFASAMVVGTCVSATGVIGFVGLIVPHLLRHWVGPSHRRLLPASALGGASLLLLADVVGRMALQPVEINVGIVTSCLGAPFFLYLLRRRTTGTQGG